VSGFWTPVGWVRGDDGWWYPPPEHGYALLNLEYRRATSTTQTAHPWPVNERALALDAEYRGLDHPSLERLIGSAITRGLRVRHATGPQVEYYSKGTTSRNEPYDTFPRPTWTRPNP